MSFNAGKFFDTELIPFFKDVPVPDLAYFFDPDPKIVAKLQTAEKKRDLFLDKSKANQDNVELSNLQREVDEIEKQATLSRTKNAVFRVKNPGSKVIGKIRDQVTDKLDNIKSAILAITQNQGSPISEKIKSFQALFNIENGGDEIFNKELGFITHACFYQDGNDWKLISLPMAIKISENFPITFQNIQQEIYKAIGEGSIIKKQK